jgi:hypothetical protein
MLFKYRPIPHPFLTLYCNVQCYGARAGAARSHKELHHLVGAGAVAVTQCSFGSDKVLNTQNVTVYNLSSSYFQLNKSYRII